MAHRLNSHQNKVLLLSLFLAMSVCLSNGLILEEKVQKLMENYIELKDDFSAKIDKLEAILELKNHQQDILAAKVARLEELEIKVQQQEIELMNLSHIQKGNVKSNTRLDSVKVGKSFILRTCRETRAADPSLTSGMYWIDPDGQGIGDDPIYVYCDMATGTTSVLHDSELTTDVGHCTDPGCYSRSVNYFATARQMVALADLSDECHQSINYNCTFAPLEVSGVAYSWWNDKNGVPRYFWSGNTTDVHICQCGIDQNCVESFMPCNCDSGLPIALSDNGIIVDKNILPITRLNFGRTIFEDSLGLHTLGRFECTGQKVVAGMPKSCMDLWWIGHTMSGLYSVLGEKQIELVYCDFGKLPNDPEFQKLIGYVDVKSSPIYFNVQRNVDFNATNIFIPFERELLNLGGAMDLQSGIFTAPRAGIYFFSFTALAELPSSSYNQAVGVNLFVNGVKIAYGWADETSTGGDEPCVVQSTLHLQAEDEIWLQITLLSEGAFLRGDQTTYFTGWLLEEDIFLSSE